MRILSKPVSGPVAEQALRLVQKRGTVGPALCSNAVSHVLGELPGFESMRGIWRPNALAEAFARLPNVTERVLRENDSDDKNIAIANMEAQERLQKRLGQ